MKKLNFIVLLALAALFLASCNGSSSDDDTSEGNWVTSADFANFGRYYAVSFTIGDSVVYAGSGNDNITTDSCLKDFWKFNGNSWLQVHSMPYGRQQAVAFSINGKGYVGTGRGNYKQDPGDVFYNDFYSYDPTTDTWASIATFPGAARARATAFAIGNKGYVTTGLTKNGIYLLDMYSYDPSSNIWKEEAGIPNDARIGASSFVYNNLGYVVGGLASTGSLSSRFFAYSPDSSKWVRLRQIANLSDSSYDDDYGTSIERLDGAIFVMGSGVYYTTGSTSDASGTLNTTWAYDPSTDLWDQRSPYEPGARLGALGFSIKGRGFVAAGWNNTTLPYNGVEEFFPNEDLDTDD